MYQPGPGFEFGLTEKLGRCKKSYGLNFFVISTLILRLTDIQFWYFGHSFKGSLNELYEAKKVMKIGYILNNYQDCWWD